MSNRIDACFSDVNCYLNIMSPSKRIRLTREESQALTRERLLESAAREIARHGAGASVRDIAEAAGYSQGAVYANFESKELMFLELLRRHMEKEAGELAAPPEAAGLAGPGRAHDQADPRGPVRNLPAGPGGKTAQGCRADATLRQADRKRRRQAIAQSPLHITRSSAPPGIRLRSWPSPRLA